MKKASFGFGIICFLSLAACGIGKEEMPPLPTLAVAENVTEKTLPTSDISDITVTLSVTENPTENSKATSTPEPTELPGLTPEAEPTVLPSLTPKQEPTVVPTPTVTPMPIVTPEPTATPAVQPTATKEPTVTPITESKLLSPEISELLEQGEIHPNTVIRGEVCTSKAEADEFVREKSLTYSSFAVIVKNAADLLSAKEYMTLYPEILNMTIEKIDRYDNGFCAVLTNVESVDDANLCYAIRTGDFSVLSECEKEIFAYLSEILDQTGARRLDTVETVKALHDYLVLELKYDIDFRELSHSPEGVMKNKTAVCDGYARTMRLLLLMTGTECKIISGTAGNQPHAWNLVNIDGDWYHVDVTWDDPVPDEEGKVRYLYFLKNDAAMAKTHSWESEITCTENEYQIYMYRDGLCDSYDTMQKVFESQIETREYLLFCYPKGGSLTKDTVLEFVMNTLQMGVSYYPEKELEDYMVLEIVNPLLEQ